MTLQGHVGFEDGKRGRSFFYKFGIKDENDKWRTIKKRGFKSDDAARNAMTIAMAGYLTGRTPISRERTTFLEFARSWLGKKKLARTSMCGYRNIIENHIAKDPIAQKLVPEIKYNDIDEYYDNCRKKGLGENTLKRHQAIVRPLFNEAIKNELQVHNPAMLVKLNKPRKYKPHTYDADMINMMLSKLKDEEIYSCVVLAMEVAERRGEILGSTWTNTDLEHGTLKISQAYYVVDGVAGYDNVKNDSSEDTVCLTHFAIKELKRIRKEQIRVKLQLGPAWQDNDLICCRADGSPWNPSTVSKKFSAALEKHGLPHIRLHDLRHSHATALNEAGVDLKAISGALRHGTVQQTSEYTHQSMSAKRKVADTYEQSVHGSKKDPRPKRGAIK
jgi:integrase